MDEEESEDEHVDEIESGEETYGDTSEDDDG